MAPVETRLRVRYAETDQMGVVYHANYLIWMEVGRVEYWRAAGLRYRDMEREDGILLIVAEVHCRYLAPAVYDEEVIIRTSVAEATNSRNVGEKREEKRRRKRGWESCLSLRLPFLHAPCRPPAPRDSSRRRPCTRGGGMTAVSRAAANATRRIQ